MKYMFLQSDGEKYWIELDDNNYPNRQIILDVNNRFHISCREDCLAEGQINEDDLDGDITIICAGKFEDMWKNILQKYEKQWQRIKREYPVGTFVLGTHGYSYPQGIIIKGEDFIAVCSCNEEFCVGKKGKYKVLSYDNVNMWLRVE